MTNSKKIILMLDIGGTLEEINNHSTEQLIKQINYLKNYYEANSAIIFLSTHDNQPNIIKTYLDIIAPQLPPTIKIGKNFYLDGTYNYNNNQTTYIKKNYNYNKLIPLEENYLTNESDIAWLGIIDDYLEANCLTKYQNTFPINIFRPSQKSPRNLEEDNTICYSTYTSNINGVIELLTRKITTTQNKHWTTLFEEQKNTLPQLTIIDIVEIIIKKQYNLLTRYLTETKLDPTYYNIINSTLRKQLEDIPLTTEETKQVKELLEYINLNLLFTLPNNNPLRKQLNKYN